MTTSTSGRTTSASLEQRRLDAVPRGLAIAHPSLAVRDTRHAGSDRRDHHRAGTWRGRIPTAFSTRLRGSENSCAQASRHFRRPCRRSATCGGWVACWLELVADRSSKEPDSTLARAVVDRARDRGLLLLTCGPHKNIVRLLPPLVATPGDAQRALEILEEVLR